jgi:3-oxoadipate enol-lactonase
VAFPLPNGQPLLLPGRGRTWIYDSGPRPSTHPPVLLLHGWMSTAALNFYRCFAALAARGRVVALDHRGHGRGLRSRRPFRLEDCADDAAAVVARLGLGPCTVVGYSMGGPVAALVWHRHPEVVDGLVLAATAASFPSARFDGAVGGLSVGAAASLSLLPSSLRRYSMGYAAGRWSAASGAEAWVAAEWRRHDPVALVQAGVALARYDATAWIGTVDAPTSVMVTERDVTVAPARQKFLADAIPGARTFRVDGDHRAVADDPDGFVPALLAACDAAHRSAPSSSVGP